LNPDKNLLLFGVWLGKNSMCLAIFHMNNSFKKELKMTKSLEDRIRSLYKPKKKYGELAAMDVLFDDRFKKSIRQLFLQDLKSNHSNTYEARVDMQWIDKIPVAKFIEPQKDLNGCPIKKKVEVGDLFIQYKKEQRNKKTNELYCIDQHSSVLVQAKIRKNSHDKVPIGYVSKNKANSTSTQLKLLQDWPMFDLYATARNKTPLAERLKVKKEQRPFAYYGAFSNQDLTWRFGEARHGQACELSFEALFSELKKGTIGKNHLDDRYTSEVADSSWNQMTEQIDNECMNRTLPRQKNKPRTLSTQLNCYPQSLIEIIRNWFAEFMNLFTKKKMLVINITVVRKE
jgi:hypothetical protein